jgi:hypothetical protein
MTSIDQVKTTDELLPNAKDMLKRLAQAEAEKRPKPNACWRPAPPGCRPGRKDVAPVATEIAARGIQDHGARAVFHAAHRPGGGGRRHSGAAAAGHEDAPQAFDLLRAVLSVSADVEGEAADRLHEAAVWFGIDPVGGLAA